MYRLGYSMPKRRKRRVLALPYTGQKHSIIPGNAGTGGIFRNCHGFVKGCFVTPLKVLFAFETEIVGFILAIEEAWEFQWKNVWKECDSNYLVVSLISLLI